MRLAIALAVLSAGCSSSCAARQARPPAAPTVYRFVIAETLPPETLICVRRDPFRSDLACLELGELRHTMRAMRRASLEVW